MPHISLPGVDLWYEDTGGPGIPVILLTAPPPAPPNAGITRYRPSRRRAIAASPMTGARGGVPGRPTNPSSRGSWVMICKGLIEHLGLDRFHLVGDRRRSHPFSGLRFNSPKPRPQRGCRQHHRRHPGCGIPGGTGPVASGGDPGLACGNYGNWAPLTGALTPEGAARWVEIEENNRPYGTTAAQPLREPITYARLSTMRVPTLVLSGNADLLAPPALMRMQAAAIPTSQYASLADVGHAGFWERPEVWNGMVLEFIGRH